jgi:ADP-ribose pyrophosphatase
MKKPEDAKGVIADRVADVVVTGPTQIGRGYMSYERYGVSINRDGEEPLRQQRDVLRGANVAAVLPVDIERDRVVLLRQFRLAGHLANGRGDMVEMVAGRIEDGEVSASAASRECAEEIGVAPQKLLELYSTLSTPGITDEQIVFFVGFVDSSRVLARAGVADESEDIEPFVVSIDEAIAALEDGRVANGILISALQWLALNRSRLKQHFERAV